MKRAVLVSAVLICGTLVGASAVCGDYTFGDPVQYWRDELGEEFAYVSEVREQQLGPIRWTSYEKFRVYPSWTLEGEDDMQKFNSLVEGMRAYSYDGGQSDPGKLDKLKAGNCQALTLYAKALLDDAGMSNSLVLEDTHMFNSVLVGDTRYEVDFAKGTLKEVEEG